MALSADRGYKVQGASEVLRAKLTASTTIYKGSILAIDPTTGLAVKAADTAGFTPCGVAKFGVVAGSGENPDIEIETGKVWIPFSSAAQADLDDFIYATADDTVAKTATNANPCGRVVDVVVSSAVCIDFRQRLPKTALV